VTTSSTRSLLLLSIALGITTGCNTLGRVALRNGRGAYNDVINRTEDEQILAMIVCQRYDETYGLLSVSSVTASLKVGASLGANVGIGSDSSYAGNLVPFSAGATYEENPTISYVPMRGEEFVERMLAPITADQTVLLASMSTGEINAMKLLVRRANGVTNPAYASTPVKSDFDRFVDAFARFRQQGVLDPVRSDDGSFRLLFHDYSPQQAADIGEMLRELGIHRTPAPGAELSLPLRFFVGSARGDGLDLETPSALEVIDVAGQGIDVPAEDVSDGFARTASLEPSDRFLAIHSSSHRPWNAAVAVEHRGYWFYIDSRDARSKQSFKILRTLIGMRLDKGPGEEPAPVLTIGVGGH
jgi:hypothetical protein